MAHIILFEHINFHGAHKHVLSAELNLNAQDDNFFNDKVSSLAVLEGNWAFYRDSGCKSQTQYPPILGPGLYSRVDAAGIKNDDISSLQPVTTSPTVFGDPLDNHIMLFEHANFRGAHKHVFVKEPNLNAQDDNFFNDKVSSLAVFGGNWAFYRDSGFNYQTQYPPILGRAGLFEGFPVPGGYPFVGFVNIQNDDMSALQPVSIEPTVRNPLPIQQGVLLFEHANFHGAHKHVVYAEANLNAPEDNFFNDKVSSIAVLSGEWLFYRDFSFQNPYKRNSADLVLGKGIYPFVGDVGIKNDDMSSLNPIITSALLTWLSQSGATFSKA